MKAKLKCTFCDGKGYIASNNYGTEIELADCPVCNGKGYTRIKVIDKRINSRKKKVELEEL